MSIVLAHRLAAIALAGALAGCHCLDDDAQQCCVLILSPACARQSADTTSTGAMTALASIGEQMEAARCELVSWNVRGVRIVELLGNKRAEPSEVLGEARTDLWGNVFLFLSWPERAKLQRGGELRARMIRDGVVFEAAMSWGVLDPSGPILSSRQNLVLSPKWQRVEGRG